MQNQISPIVSQLLSIANAADHVLLNLSDDRGSFAATAALTEASGDPDNEVIHLAWQDNGHDMATDISESSLADGKWIGDSFICEDCEGDHVQLRFPGTCFVTPDMQQIPATARFEQYRIILLEGLHSISTDVKGGLLRRHVIDELISLLSGDSARLFTTLFPAQYLAMKEIHDLNLVSELEEGYDWNTLTPALSKISVTLGHQPSDSAEDDNNPDSIGDVVDHVRTMAGMYDFTPDADCIADLVRESADLLSISLTDANVVEACRRLLDGSPAEDMDWTASDAENATREGWNIFDCDDRKEIQRDDEALIFKNDIEATQFVKNQAANGDALALRAIAYLKKVGSPDVKRFGLDQIS